LIMGIMVLVYILVELNIINREVAMGFHMFFGLFLGGFLFALCIVGLVEMLDWHGARKELFPFPQKETRRRKLKIILCYVVAFFFGCSVALRWGDLLHDPFYRVRLWWHRLCVRKDEFHSSLDMDVIAMANMNAIQQEAYTLDLARRRRIAHLRDMDE